MRAGRVRDIGVKSSMLQATFMNSLTLMSALALALVYGLGGVLAIGGHLQAGAIVSLALLLTRLYAPLTALANARVEIASALVSFERVFEVLDLEPLIRERPAPWPCPTGRSPCEFDDVRFAYPSADKVSLASLEEVAVLDDRGGDEVLHGISFTAQPGQMVALVGSSGAGKSTIASLLARLYDVTSGAVRLSGVDVRDLTFASLQRGRRHGHPGRAPVPRVDPVQPDCWPHPTRPTTSCGTRCAAPGWPTSSPTCPTAWTPSSASAATGSPAASGSG